MFSFDLKPFECEITVDRILRLQSARRLHTTSTGSHYYAKLRLKIESLIRILTKIELKTLHY